MYKNYSSPRSLKFSLEFRDHAWFAREHDSEDCVPATPREAALWLERESIRLALNGAMASSVDMDGISYVPASQLSYLQRRISLDGDVTPSESPGKAFVREQILNAREALDEVTAENIVGDDARYALGCATGHLVLAEMSLGEAPGTHSSPSQSELVDAMSDLQLSIALERGWLRHSDACAFRFNRADEVPGKGECTCGLVAFIAAQGPALKTLNPRTEAVAAVGLAAQADRGTIAHVPVATLKEWQAVLGEIARFAEQADDLEDEDDECVAALRCEALNYAIEPYVCGILGRSPMNEAPGTFQDRVQQWMQSCFGPVISSDTKERNYRFLEEAIELAQACGCTKDDACRLVDYVFNRAVGEKSQEVGGVCVTLAALCSAHGIDVSECGETELARIWGAIEGIRAKHATKPLRSPLPGRAPGEAE